MKHYDDLGGPGAWMGYLQSGRFLRSDVEPVGDGPPWMGNEVYLKPSDEYCDSCREIIDPEDWYGPAWVNVLANQKKKYDGTWCGDCFSDLEPK